MGLMDGLRKIVFGLCYNLWLWDWSGCFLCFRFCCVCCLICVSLCKLFWGGMFLLRLFLWFLLLKIDGKVLFWCWFFLFFRNFRGNDMFNDFICWGFLGFVGVLGCFLVVSFVLMFVSLVVVSGDNCLVVIILWGGMDGIDVLCFWGDLNFVVYWLNLVVLYDNEFYLNEFYGIYSGLKFLMFLWDCGELFFV